MNNLNMGFSKADEISLRSNIDAGMQCPYIKEETSSRTSCALKNYAFYSFGMSRITYLINHGVHLHHNNLRGLSSLDYLKPKLQKLENGVQILSLVLLTLSVVFSYCCPK